jgi:DNA-binding MarR family transcriptional regulator
VQIAILQKNTALNGEVMAKGSSSNTRTITKVSAGAHQAADLKRHTLLWNRPGFLVRRLHQIHMGAFLEEMAADNITPIQYGLLSVLSDMPGLDQLSLAEELGIDRANVADVLNRLEIRGLVSRVPSTKDKRRNLCSATPEGRSFVHKHFENMRRAQERMLNPLTSKERADFMRLMRRVVEANNDLGRARLRPTISSPARERPAARPKKHSAARTSR